MKGKNFKQTAIIILLAVNLIFTIGFVVVPKVSAATGCFPDTNGHWAEEFICWLSDNGIAGGYPDGTFGPENRVTRAELAVFFSNYNDYIGSSGVGPYYTQVQVDALLATERARIADLESTLASVSLENSGQDFVFTNVNVHVRSGSGTTEGTMNGRGNLIVGYNDDQGSDASRTGSHNLIIGDEHSYTSYGGVVAGYENRISGNYAAVLGGYFNHASGGSSSILGGYSNSVSGSRATVSGGGNNSATDHAASVSGGRYNDATGEYSSVSGGIFGTASGIWSAVLGGAYNEATGEASTVSGGGGNTAGDGNVASGIYSSISGGNNNTASGGYSSVTGGENNTVSGNYSVIGGGQNDTLSDPYKWGMGAFVLSD